MTSHGRVVILAAGAVLKRHAVAVCMFPRPLTRLEPAIRADRHHVDRTAAEEL